jgi:DNA-binding Lrp family transcriptional regulator
VDVVPNVARPVDGLDDVDESLVRLLGAQGRMPNNALAREVGVAESTCTARVRGLWDRGIVTGIHAELDLAALGRGVQAVVAVRFSGQVREDIEGFRDQVSALPGVVQLLHVSGANDYLVHVAAASTDQLRDFVMDQITSRPGVAHAETSVVFERVRGRRPV